MKKKLSSKFVKYLIVGFSSVFFDFIILIILKSFFTSSSALSVIISQLLVLGYNFNLNKHWAFKNKGLPLKQFIRYLVLAGFNYIFSVAIMYLFSDIFGFNYIFIRLLTIACITSWNFILYKYYVYTD